MEEDKYTTFIKSGLAVGFTDDQIDWLWEQLKSIVEITPHLSEDK